MFRLVLIAAACLVSFFLVLGLLYLLTGNGELAVSGAAVLGFICMPILLLRSRRISRPSSGCPQGPGLYPECLFVASISDGRITVTHPDRPVQSIALADLKEVAVVTNDSGPWGADVWWLLIGNEEGAGCTFPGGATGEQTVLAELQRLPGFNNDAFIQAMGSTSNARFSCWVALQVES